LGEKENNPFTTETEKGYCIIKDISKRIAYDARTLEDFSKIIHKQ
jgi:hypothetical protein